MELFAGVHGSPLVGLAQEAHTRPVAAPVQAPPSNGSSLPPPPAEKSALGLVSLQHGVTSSIRRVLMALGGGTGMIKDHLTPMVQAEYDTRSNYQSTAVVCLSLLAYIAVLLVVASLLHWRVDVRSSVTYFASNTGATMEGRDAVGFLSAFNQGPRQLLLQVTGIAPPPADDDASPGETGRACRVAFNFALDLSQWIVHEEWSVTACSREGDEAPDAPPRPLLAGIEAEELERLQTFLETDSNDLASVVLEKNINWPDWEDVATNIRQRIKQCGFDGNVNVRFEALERIRVQKNTTWARLMTHRSFPILCMLSIIGWPIYTTYMSWRCTEHPVLSRFRVDIEAEDYWSLISDQLSASGFNVTAASSTGGSD